MLVLSRKRDEKVVIGGGVEVTVVEIRGDKVRLGIEAPKDVPVHREEVARVILRKGGSLAVPIDGAKWREALLRIINRANATRNGVDPVSAIDEIWALAQEALA